MSIKLYSYGGAEEVTGSKHFLETERSKIMIDCGAFQGKRQEADEKNRNWPFSPVSINAMVLTHAHFDHCGLIPMLVKKGYTGSIYSTSATRDLANIIMMDSAKIQARDEEYLSKQAKKKGETFNWKPLYVEKDVVAALNQFVTVSYNRPLFLTEDIQVNFYDAGHILGSSQAYFTINTTSGKKINLAYSGDLGRKNKPIIRDPQKIPDTDYLVLESTYGDKLHESSEDILVKLAEVINKTVARNGKVVIPAFAIERTQDLIFYLHLLADDKKIPDIPIYVDSPMAVNATTIFKIHPECYDEETQQAFIDHHENPFGFNALRYIESISASKEINSLQGPAIIISSSGMCEAGRIQHHLLHNIANPNNTVLIVGYMAQDTLGRKIQERLAEVRILGLKVPLNAEVTEIKALSAHADYKEIGNYVTRLDLKRLKKVFLVHGEPESQAHLKKYLLGKGVRQVEIVKYGHSYELT